MEAAQALSLGHLEEKVERAKAEVQSMQPRFDEPEQILFAALRWLDETKEPEYKTDSRKRDDWLSSIWMKDPHLGGVLNSAVMIHSNRGWAVTGGRNQVRNAVAAIHNWTAFPTVTGYRDGQKEAALSFYHTDINTILEVGRYVPDGLKVAGEMVKDDAGNDVAHVSELPFGGFFHTDPVRCKLEGSTKTPLTYDPPNGRQQKWRPWEFVRLPDMPHSSEKFRGLGFCAVSRCIELLKIMIAVYQHELESLGARAPKGLLLLNNISQRQWDTAMTLRESKLASLEREYFGGVAIIASSGVDQIDAKLVGLSQLPTGFDIRVFTDLLMYGYALAFGFDPSEFWPVQFGSLGRGLEAQMQHQKATGKGGLSYPLTFSEKLQKILTTSRSTRGTYFEFDQRDDSGDLTRAAVYKAWAEAATELQAAGLPPEQALEVLSMNGIIPPEWTVQAEETSASDTERMHAEIYRACELYPDQPIVRYRWPFQQIDVLYERASDAFTRRSFVVNRAAVLGDRLPAKLLSIDDVKAARSSI